jgi:hypothetical protein
VLLIISLRITNDINGSEEIVQQVFANLWIRHKSPAAIDEPIQFTLVKIAREKSYQYYYKHYKPGCKVKDASSERVSSGSYGIWKSRAWSNTLVSRRKMLVKIRLIDKMLSGALTNDDETQLSG